MTEPKSKLQSRFSLTTTRSPELGLDQQVQQVVTPLAADDAFADEPTLVGLDFDETHEQSK